MNIIPIHPVWFEKIMILIMNYFLLDELFSLCYATLIHYKFTGMKIHSFVKKCKFLGIVTSMNSEVWVFYYSNCDYFGCYVRNDNALARRSCYVNSHYLLSLMLVKLDKVKESTIQLHRVGWHQEIFWQNWC